MLVLSNTIDGESTNNLIKSIKKSTFIIKNLLFLRMFYSFITHNYLFIGCTKSSTRIIPISSDQYISNDSSYSLN